MSEKDETTAEMKLDEIYDSFSIELEDGESRLPASEQEIKKAKTLLAHAKAQNPESDEVLDQIAQVETVIEESSKRRFAGSKWIMIVLGAFIAIMMYMGVYENLTSENTIEMSQRILASRIAFNEKQLVTANALPDSNPDKAERVEQYNERLTELRAFTPETFKAELDSEDNGRAFSNLLTWGIWLILLGAYYFASLSPQFLIDKRLAQMNLATKSAGWIKKFAFGVIGIFMAMPSITETRVRWSDGSKSTEYGFEGLILKIFGLIVVVGIIIWLMMFMLPWLIIINYLRNYQYEKIDAFFDNLMEKFRSAKAKVA